MLLTLKQKLMITGGSMLFIILIGVLVSAFKEPAKTTRPVFENFEMVKVSLTGEKGQVVDNKAKWDKKLNCWKVKVKYSPEKGLEGKLKFLTDAGTIEKLFYEKELERVEDEENIYERK